MYSWIYLVGAILCFGFILFLVVFTIIHRKDFKEGFKNDPPKPYKPKALFPWDPDFYK